MVKVYLDYLAVEVTRQCNMQCPHCLRGEQENKDIDMRHVETLLQMVDGIGSITFTGGEPSLNVPAIVKTLELCKERDIAVGSFWLATNGKEVSNDFLCAMIDWYAYCFDDEICGVALSKDKYHESIPSINVSRLQALNFYDGTSKAIDFSTVPVVNSGRARKLAVKNKRDLVVKPNRVERFAKECFEVVGDEQVIVSDMLVLTVDGEILCDFDYEYGATHKVKICDVGEFERYCSNFIDAGGSSAANRCAS